MQEEANSTVLERFTKSCKVVFSQMDREDDVEDQEINGIEDEENVMKRGRNGDDPFEIDVGVRSEGWYERISSIVSENRSRSVKNRRLLERLDYRTIWIARLILGLIVTVLGGIVLGYLTI